MKSVLISIQPKWCELIANGKKTVEVRKTKPKLYTPFKVYIYCTLSGSNEFFKEDCGGNIAEWNKSKMALKKGKVIGEFVCNSVEHYTSNCTVFESVLLPSPSELEEMCLTLEEFNGYGTRGKLLYGWHISNLVIYDKPKELSEFVTLCSEWEKECFNTRCLRCKYYFSNCADMRHECTAEGEKPLKRPPQSWCYVERKEDKGK